jgi:calcineurin-like phosphoesterase family protein
MPDIFFTADEHFEHKNAMIGWGNPDKARPWSSLIEMKEGLIERHNSKVKRGDLVYHIGDMFWRTCDIKTALEIIGRLNGQHYYVLGNHEEVMESEELRSKFVWVKERARIQPPGPPKHPGIILDHYAGRVWDGSFRGSWQLYGHSHGDLPEIRGVRAFDVGVDANNYYPVSLEEATTKINGLVRGVIENA